jgi:NadR type nicotinamide-nucleotide adenylyltransferase
METAMETGDSRSIKRIVITGPESTGKTTLTKQLGRHYHTVFVTEYARDYVEQLKRAYNYQDVLHIAEKQRKQFHAVYPSANEYIFFDTYLIITKIWFIELYDQYPVWIDEELAANKAELYLLCDTDLPWIADNVRENSGEARKRLFERYRNELERFNCHFRIVMGNGADRFQNALSFIDELKNK